MDLLRGCLWSLRVWAAAQTPQNKLTQGTHPNLLLKCQAGMLNRHPAGRSAGTGAEEELVPCPPVPPRFAQEFNDHIGFF